MNRVGGMSPRRIVSSAIAVCLAVQAFGGNANDRPATSLVVDVHPPALTKPAASSPRDMLALADDAPEQAKPKPAVEVTELERIPPKSPAEALKSFQPRRGFRVELVACEPLIKDPVAVDFDADGRMYVVELPEYNQYANEDFDGHGLIRRLEDTDGDGVYDSATVFIDNLTYPTAVLCYGDGIFVGAAPDIVFCRDTNGDGKADEQTRIFTGFGTDKAGEAHLNSFRWGFDNRIHVSTSLAGGDIRRVGDENTPAVSVRGRGFVFDPKTYAFELTSGGGQHGLTRDDWGRTFVCQNSQPMNVLMYDGRYLARNKYLRAPAAEVNIAPDGKFTKLFRISPVEPWRELRTRLRSQGLVPGSDEGGTASGFFTGASGVTVYRGDAWPAEFYGSILVGDVANNIVYRARLEENGLQPVAHRADPDAEFLASTDVWFRPVQFANAPDGSLYVLDMSRELIEGAAFLPPQILEHLDVASGQSQGRIYRIVPDDYQRRPPVRLSQAGTAELVALLEHRNGWHRDTASRLLYERQDRAAVPLLRALVSTSQVPVARMTALYSLEALGALSEADVLAALDDEEAWVRVHALRLAEAFPGTAPAIAARVLKAADDPELRVRYQAAFTLGAWPSSAARQEALAKLLRRDGRNSWMRLAVASSLAEGAGSMFQLLSDDATYRGTSEGREFLLSLVRQVGASNRNDDLARVLTAIDVLATADEKLASQTVKVLAESSPGGELDGAAAGKTGALLKQLIAEARKAAPDTKRAPEDRVAAVRTLGLTSFAEVADVFEQALTPTTPQPVQAAAVETLARFDDAQVAGLLLSAWNGLSPQVRARAAETLFSRPLWVSSLLRALEDGTLGRGEVDPARLALLRSHPDASIRRQAEKLLATSGLSQRRDVVEQYRRALELKPNVEAGRALFRKTCTACHRLENEGRTVGADLSAIRDRGTEAVLLNILDPNREVKPQYLNYVVATLDGRTLTGMIGEETANSITLRRPDGTDVTVLRVDIEELRSTGLSFMPEGLEKQIDVQGMADLLGYLNSL